MFIHPDVAAAGAEAEIPVREPVNPLTEGGTSKRMRERAGIAPERAPWLFAGMLRPQKARVWLQWPSRGCAAPAAVSVLRTGAVDGGNTTGWSGQAAD